MNAFPHGARCVFRTVATSSHWKAGTVNGPPTLDLDQRPVMVPLLDQQGREWPVSVNHIFQTGWEQSV